MNKEHIWGRLEDAVKEALASGIPGRDITSRVAELCAEEEPLEDEE